VAHGKTSTDIAKLDALAENLLVGKNISASIAVVNQIIALNPPNRQEYEQLYKELTKR
jgi:DNA-binding SARP family transcriptional activator